MIFFALFFVVGLVFLLFRRSIGSLLFEQHSKIGLPVKKEGYPYMVGGLGAGLMLLSSVVLAMNMFRE